MSNKYGANPDYVLAGGGNTSFKDDTTLYIKGSGTSLATITEEGFVAMDRRKLSDMMEKAYPENDDERESAALKDLMDSRLPGEFAKRPSVETLLHNLFPFSYVLHLHPALINGMTCAFDGAGLCDDIFEGEAVWVDETKPGYKLAVVCDEALSEFKKLTGKDAQLLFIQNHGVFVAGDTVEEIDEIMADTVKRLSDRIDDTYDFDDYEYADHDTAAKLAPVIRALQSDEGASVVSFRLNNTAMTFISDSIEFAPLQRPYTPDHIVYCRAFPLFVESGDNLTETISRLKKGFKAYKEDNGYPPKIIAVSGLGFFICGDTKKAVDTTWSLLLDSMKITIYARSLSFCRHMSDEMCEFIINWEVESYRAKAFKGNSAAKRLQNKVAVITGAAQGFGKGIAKACADNGAYVVIADMNYEGACACADEINSENGSFTALPVKVNVTDEDSVKAMVRDTVNVFGGIDLFINNAGIVRSGSLDVMTKSNFELVTNVNYTAYFICVKYVSEVMKLQYEHSEKKNTYFDIVEINSKSGLEGSNKNFAYAGSKFGGIGLTQSFALELVEYNIKVNAVCPGNFLDGPLWSDPEKGLFVQYLKAGKVPGAKTVEDVRKFYESKVPMKRGCEINDVVRAILYITEQLYETGQAIPVTGGQTMLN